MLFLPVVFPVESLSPAESQFDAFEPLGKFEPVTRPMNLNWVSSA